MLNHLERKEIDFCLGIISEFQKNSLCPNLTAKIIECGFNQQSIPFLFELRFAHELARRDISFQYEFQAFDDTSVDFRFSTEGACVLAELLSVGTTSRVNDSISTKSSADGAVWHSLDLSDTHKDKRLTETGEVLIAQQKICEKVFKNGKPVKFPLPAASDAFHIIVVDMRGFLGGIPSDHADYFQLCFGNDAVGLAEKRFWRADGRDKPVLGIFQDTERPRGAREIRKRIHGILFTRDTTYGTGSILDPKTSILIPNPNLLCDEASKRHLRAVIRGQVA
jgi:hypothetical protein